MNRLLGLYPSAGRVFLDGHPLEEYDPQQLRRYFHALFQDLQIYAVTLRENLLMDLLPAEGEEDTQKAAKILVRALHFGAENAIIKKPEKTPKGSLKWSSNHVAIWSTPVARNDQEKRVSGQHEREEKP